MVKYTYIKFTSSAIFRCIYSSVALTIVVIVSHSSSLVLFHVPKLNLHWVSADSPFPSPQFLATAIPFSFPMNLTSLRTSNKVSLQGSSMLLHLSEFPPFLRLNSIPVCVYHICLSIHFLMDTWVVFIFWLLWIMLFWTRIWKYLFGFLLLLLCGIVPNLCF